MSSAPSQWPSTLGLLALFATAASLAAQPTATTGADRLAAWEQHKRLEETSQFSSIGWRPIGPVQAGARIEAIAVPSDQPSTLYVGVGSGNLWKSIDNGITFEPIFDHESAFSIGDIAVAPSDSQVIWVGTGETQPRHSGYAYSGTGVFRSDDAGTTWRHLGLADSHHIGKILVHPEEPDTVYVAALGHFFGKNEERGLFKTTDGGSSWSRVLYLSDGTGVVDAAFDPRDPETLYAAAWQAVSGTDLEAGPESGLFKSSDGGATWRRLDNGLPRGPLGRMGLDVSLSNPDTVYAFIDDRSPWKPPAGKTWQEIEEKDRKAPFATAPERDFVGASLYRSDDAGENWRLTNEEDLFGVFGVYGWKFCDVRVSPTTPDEVFILGLRAFHSSDGGNTFERIGETIRRLHDTRGEGMHLDHHEIWIDPDNPDRVLLGNDGGLFQSWDRGRSWLHHNNISATEFYSVSIWDDATDEESPYLIFGGTQDNAALFGPSDADLDSPLSDPWENVYLDRWTGGDSFDTYVDPSSPNIVYYEHQHGDMLRMDIQPGGDVQSGGESAISIKPTKPGQKQNGDQAEDARLDPDPWRFGWYTPFLISNADDKTLFVGADRVLHSSDRGDSWQSISPVLADEPQGPRAPVPFGVISALDQSERDPAHLLVGTEGGSLYLGDLKRNDPDERWRRIDTAALPDLWVTRAVLSRHHNKTVYLSMSGYRYENHQAYLFGSDDNGETWRSIRGNLPDATIHVVLEDPEEPDMIYVGTDLGVYVSLDRGGSWIALSAKLPTTPVHDLELNTRKQELVAGTHGRAVWIADVEPVRTALLFEGGENL